MGQRLRPRGNLVPGGRGHGGITGSQQEASAELARHGQRHHRSPPCLWSTDGLMCCALLRVSGRTAIWGGDGGRWARGRGTVGERL